MTIAAGYHCYEGIVLCADTEETVQEYIKHDVPKIFRFPDAWDYKPELNCALFAGAGDGPLIESLALKMWKGTKSLKDASLDDMVTAFEDVLFKEYQRLVPAYQKDSMPQAHFMVAIRSAAHKDLELIRITGPVIERQLPYGAIGYGLTLHTYLASRFLYPKTGLNFTANVMTYMIDQVKTHVTNCGGNTDLYMLDYEGKVKVESQQDTQRRTDMLREIDTVARYIAGLAMNPSTTRETAQPIIEHYMNELFKKIDLSASQNSKDKQ
ncbi:MAG TPA: hypothetical protein VFQ41_04180 [Candidatus Angelobacter sp.]|nr:hypothetical protein [Candidatus Angelobacter sp.]